MQIRFAKYLFFAAVLVLVVMGSTPLIAQDQGSARGNIGGTVVDKTDAVVAGARVTLVGPMGLLSKTTDEQGAFTFPTLIPGFYEVKVEKEGFKVADIKDIEVLINKTASVRVVIEPGTVTETIEVAATAVAVENTSAAVTADISDSTYTNLPLGRGVSNVFYLSPGVVSGLGTGQANPSISGASGLENLYVADGIAMNDPAFGGLGVYSRVYGPLGTGINLSFVKEVQVKTAGFEPQYGHATGGIIQMVTKSGGNAMHGVIGGFFQAPGMTALYRNDDDFHPNNLVGRELHQGSYEGDFELGGYVPLSKLKDHLFFFGTFNPTWNTEQVAPALGSGLFTSSGGEVDRKTTIWDYAAKLTWRLNDRHSIESTVSGDPAHTNAGPFNSLNIDNTSANSSWNLGSRNWAVRYNGALGSDFLINGAFTWNWNHYSETPAQDIYEIVDLTQTGGLPGQRGSFRAQGIGLFEPYDSNSKGLEVDGAKGYRFGGSHTFSLGYTYQKPNYDDTTNRSGPRFTIPTLNATGTNWDGGADPSSEAGVAGQSDNATFQLQLAPGTCTLCPLMTIPGFSSPQAVYLKQARGTFSNATTHSTGSYHSAFVNDSWQMGTHATLNVGLRWEQQRLTGNGNVISALFNDMWSPRVSFIVDPKGDRKSKIYASFGRYAYIVPLDAALRSLSSENDFDAAAWAPDFDPATGMVKLNSLGTVTPVLDAAHLLNNAVGGIGNSPTVSEQSPSNPFNPGTRMEYNDEFVVGAEHEFRGGIVASVRYIDRRMKRVIEDFGGVSVEQALSGLGQFYAIGNPNAAADFVINSNEQTFPGVFSSDPTQEKNITTDFKNEKSNPSASNQATLQGLGVPASCFDSNHALAPIIANVSNTFGASLGGACFPSVNQNPWTVPNPKCSVVPPPMCGTPGNPPTLVNASSALFGGELGSDGKPDGNPNPIRQYQAVEFEVNKPLSQNWAILANFRVGRLMGNYEGAYLNNNGQSDPGISTMFDFTSGKLGILGKLNDVGPLNTDRREVMNVATTYVLDRSPLKGLVLGSRVTVQSGVPLSTFAAQQAYTDQGEIPLNGRGDLGRSPVLGTVDAHVEYPWRLGEGKSLRLGMDFFNIANSRRAILANQFVDLAFGVPNQDFQKPGSGTTHGYPSDLINGFEAPFSARATVSFNF